jgi:hypothetical protein
MTKTIDRLERAGLVERRAHASDRRRVEVVLTAKGEEVTDRLLRAEISAHQEILADIGPAGRERLRDLLDQAIERLVDGMPRSSPGSDPWASSRRLVTPMVGRPSTAPRCRARPARRGWSRPVALTSSTSGGSPRARTAACSAGPSRSAKRPGV